MAAPQSVLQRSFISGELSPALGMRADLAKYGSGLRTCKNFIVQRYGGVANRAGSRFINALKTTSANAKILRYKHDVPSESVLIEAGVNYLRFYQHGALLDVVTSSLDDWSGATDYIIGDLVKKTGVGYYCVKAHTNHTPANATYWYALPADGAQSIYELPTVYTDTPLFNWSQSGRTITLTHRSKQTYELIFVALTRWVLRAVDTKPQVAAPTNLVATCGAGTRKFGYIVTAAAPGSYEESEASNQSIDLTAAAPTEAAPHTLAWDAVLTPALTGTASPEYYVYCDPYANGTYGYIGTATGQATFNNPGIDPDFTVTPPIARVLFTATNEHPHCSATYQQRRAFANTNNTPDGVWLSRVGFPLNYGIASPLQDDDAITFRIAGNDNHPVRHMVALNVGLVLMTDGGAWVMQGQSGKSLIPNGLDANQDSYAGANGDVRPAPVGNGIIYVQARQSIPREIRFDIAVSGLAGKDLTVYAGHLFDGRTILALDYAETPHSIIWCVRSDGALLGLTYVPEQEVMAWHRHETAGRFEDVCVLPADGEDETYVIVSRTIQGATVRYLEKLEPRTILDWARDSFFVDAGLTYDGAVTSSVSGLDHLEGQRVYVVGDGAVQAGPFTVSGGAVTLDTPAAVVHVGLPIEYPDLETLDLDVQGAAVRDRQKRVGSLTLLLETSSRTCLVGADVDHLTPLSIAPFDPTGQAFTGAIELNILSTFAEPGRLVIRQVDPLPLTVLGVIPNLELGG